MVIVGFSGKIGSGKSTICSGLEFALRQMKYRPFRRSFAGGLKEEICQEYLIPHHMLYDQAAKEFKYRIGLGLARKWKREHIAPEWRENGYVTIRQILQWYGTEYTRAKDEDYWVKTLLRSIKRQVEEYTSNGVPTEKIVALVDDVRFPNELAAIKEHGVCFRIETYPDWRPTKFASHPSETSLDDTQWNDSLVLRPENDGQESVVKHVIEMLTIWRLL